MKKTHKLLLSMLILSLAVMFGCSAFQTALTPCFIDNECIEFADANVPLIMPYTTISDAYYVNGRMDYVNAVDRL